MGYYCKQGEVKVYKLIMTLKGLVMLCIVHNDNIITEMIHVIR